MHDLADKDAFGRFFSKHRAMLEGIAYRMTGDAHLAEDVVSNAAVRVWRRFEKHVPDRPLGYLVRAVQNEARDQLRRAAAADARDRLWPDGAEDGARFEATVDDRDLIKRLLPSLPDKQRRTVELRYLEDVPDEQIAQRLGIGVVTVRSNAHRALDRLRRELAATEVAAA